MGTQPICVRKCWKSISSPKFEPREPNLPSSELPNTTGNFLIQARKCARTYRRLIGSRSELLSLKLFDLLELLSPNFSPKLVASIVSGTPVINTNSRTHQSTMGNNASSVLGGEANRGLRDVGPLEPDREVERPTELTEDTNSKSRLQLPVPSKPEC